MTTQQPEPAGNNRLMGRRATRIFVVVFVFLAFLVAALAVRTVIRIQSDSELRDQLQEVHEESSGG